MTKVAVFSAGSWGTAFSVVLGDAGNDVVLWARRDEVADAINTKRENTEYLPGIELPRERARHDRRRRGGRRRGRGRAHRAVADAAGQPHRVGAAHPGEGRHGLADEGRRARLPQADERGHRRGDRRRPRADRGRQRPQPGQGDRPPRAGRLGGRVRRRGRRPAAAGPVPHRRVPALHLHRRAGLRDRRRLQERRRPGRRHGGRAGLRRQHHRLRHHPRPRRDRPPRDGAGRQPADPDGPGRARRPRGHLLVPAVAQPHLRREPRQGHDHRGDLRLHQPGRRGRQVLQVAARPGARAPASTPRSPSTSTRSWTAGSRRWR